MEIFKQLKLVVIGMILVASISCEKTEIDPFINENTSVNIEKGSGSSANSAEVYKTTFEYDLSEPQWSEFNSCTGETLDIVEGIYRVSLTYVVNGKRGVVKYHANTSNYKLVSPTTGAVYVGSSTHNDIFTFVNPGDSYPAQTTVTLSTLLTTPGKNNNSYLKSDLHITLNANGTMTAYVDNFRSGCK